MYYCEDCEHFFEEFGNYWLEDELISVCPYCESTNYTWKGDKE